MKNLVLLSLCFLMASLLSVNSYTKSSNHLSTTTKKDSILFIIKQPKNKAQIMTFNIFGINPNHITQVYIMGKDSIDLKYPNIGVTKACELTLDSSTVMTRLDTLLSKRQIPVTKRNLPIYWGDTLVDKEDFWINEKDLKRIVVEDSKIIIEIDEESSSPKEGELMIR